jgi:hypothetical protein
MHIIFGEEQATILAEKYTVLELDTLQFEPNGPLATAYCVIENVSITDLPRIESMRNLHSQLIVNYRRRDWNYCDQALDQLVGFWSGEIDSFYNELRTRIAKYIEQDPGESWDGIIKKHTTQ